MANSFVQAAKKVLQTEADALETLKNDLPNDFSDLAVSYTHLRAHET